MTSWWADEASWEDRHNVAKQKTVQELLERVAENQRAFIDNVFGQGTNNMDRDKAAFLKSALAHPVDKKKETF